MSPAYTTRTTCRSCGSSESTFLFSLGEQYVSDFVEPGKERSGPRCPIELELCHDCDLVQARHTAPQEFLYTRHYWYTSGRNDTMKAALADVTASVERVVNLAPGDIVLDIGSNDGTLLRSYRRPGIVRVGVEPATNLRREGERGIDVFLGDFWSADKYLDTLRLAGPSNSDMKAKAVTACGMFYDLEDPNPFVADIARVLAPDGVFVAQLMCLKQTLQMADVGNYAHEHLEFYSLGSLEMLFQRHGLRIFDIEENDVNGGSYRIFASLQEAERLYPETSHTQAVFLQEELLNLDEQATYQKHSQRLERNRDRCVRFLQKEIACGKSVWVYGASTKGNVLLQWLGVDRSTIAAAADRSPEKWGKVTVGSGIPIMAEETFRLARPDYALVLPYAFLPEFVERERAWLEGGGKFVVPLPEFRIVGKEVLR